MSSLIRKQARLVSGNVINMLLGAGTSIYLARVLGPGGRGELALYVGLGTVLCTFFGLGMPHACAYYCRAIPGCERKLAIRLLVSGLAVGMLIVGTLFAAGGFFSSSFLDGKPLVLGWAVFIGFYGAVLYCGLGVSSLTIALGEAKLAANSANIGAILAFLVTVGLISVFPWKLEAAFFGMSLGPMASIFLQCRKLLTRPDGECQAPTLWDLIKYGLQTHPGSMGALAFKRLDIFVISHFAGVSSVGLYTVGLSLRDMALTVPRAAAGLLAGELADPGNRMAFRRILMRNLATNFLLALFLAAGLWILSPFVVPFFFGKDFLDSGHLAAVLGLGIIFLAPAMLISSATKALRQPMIDSVSTLAASIGGLLILVPLAATYGATGAAWTSVISSALLILTSLTAILVAERLSHKAPQPVSS